VRKTEKADVREEGRGRERGKTRDIGLKIHLATMYVGR
jgi:hypothetical protein